MEMEEGPGRGADGSCLGATVIIGGAGVDTLLGTRAMIGAGVGVLLGTRLGARDGALVGIDCAEWAAVRALALRWVIGVSLSLITSHELGEPASDTR